MATKRTPAVEQKPMAYVEIGYHGYLVPLADGQRLVGILAGAVKATQRFRDRGYVYEVEQPADPVEVSLTAVRPTQIVAVRADVDGSGAHGQALLGREALKLTGPAR